MSDHYEFAEELIRELTKRGHGAAHVPDAPIHGVNLYPNNQGRTPSDTAWLREDDYVEWGPNWDYSVKGTPAEIAAAIEVTFG